MGKNSTFTLADGRNPRCYDGALLSIDKIYGRQNYICMGLLEIVVK
ncbi:MAG: hypothetical protein LBG98_02085 [Puniceicoccales bacterium]|nr:hypothetical protein [Puniceicoccales bacterium]